jgi:hypothetical protein
LRALSLCTCCRHYPGTATGGTALLIRSVMSAFPERVIGSACASSFSRLTQRSLALRPAHSRCHQFVARLPEGFRHFVTSMPAPVASGWSGCRVGLAPTGKRRLFTAHAQCGHPALQIRPLTAAAEPCMCAASLCKALSKLNSLFGIGAVPTFKPNRHRVTCKVGTRRRRVATCGYCGVCAHSLTLWHAVGGRLHGESNSIHEAANEQRSSQRHGQGSGWQSPRQAG